MLVSSQKEVRVNLPIVKPKLLHFPYKPSHYETECKKVIFGAMAVRKASFQDVRELAELHITVWRAAYKGLMPQVILDSLSLQNRKTQWQNSLRHPDEQVYLYEKENQVLGFLSLGPQRDEDKDKQTTTELYTLYVSPEAWGKGIGRDLWLSALTHLNGYNEVSLWVLKGNRRAIRFYEKAGFEHDGHEKTERFGDHTVHELRYVRSLT